jgi:hypothetical protein
MRSKLVTAVVALMGIILLAGHASAAEIPWSNPSGSTDDFFWSNGRTDNGLFGSPTVVGNSFVFFPSNFIATSSNGVAGQISDRLAFTLIMKPDVELIAVTMNEAGSYSITGVGTVNAQGGLFVKNLGGAGTVNATMISTPSMPHSTESQAAGLWNGTANAVVPQGWTQVEVVFNNILQATTGERSAAAIEKLTAEPIVVTFVIPEPATASLLLLAVGGLLVRRRAR